MYAAHVLQDSTNMDYLYGSYNNVKQQQPMFNQNRSQPRTPKPQQQGSGQPPLQPVQQQSQGFGKFRFLGTNHHSSHSANVHSTTPQSSRNSGAAFQSNAETPQSGARSGASRPPSSGKKSHTTKISSFSPLRLFSRTYLLRDLEHNEPEPFLTLVLDLDETLVFNRLVDLPEAILRPRVLDMLVALRQLPGIELVLWTASTEETAKPVVQQLSVRGNVFDDVIYRNDIWFTEPVHTKDLRLLGRNMDRVLVIDNAPNCCKMNRDNALLIDDFHGVTVSDDDSLLNAFRIVERIIAEVRLGRSVPEILGDLSNEENSSGLLHPQQYSLPEAWTLVNLKDYPPLSVPPQGRFFRINKMVGPAC